MCLTKDSVRWALTHLSVLGDSDLFPRPAELDALLSAQEHLINLLTSREISQFEPGPARRFMIPKDEFGFRRATQLNPLDSIILTAIVYQYGNLVEARRRPLREKRVFSYRFKPQSDYWLYDRAWDWTPFWEEAYEKCDKYSHALLLDVSDFYNQIYHHAFENQLIEAGLPNAVIKWVKNLLGSLTGQMSRGIPVGPHAIHLIAEATMVPIDNSFVSHGMEFVRFVDDMMIFGSSERECRKRQYEVANILDQQQRLILNPSKTKLTTTDWLRDHCVKMIEDHPVNDLEEHLLSIIRKYSKGNPYQAVLLSEISPDDLAQFSKDALENILVGYMQEKHTNYIRLRWFLRRLTQIAHPGALPFCLNNLESLTPAMADVCHYILAASGNATEDVLSIGERLIKALEDDLIQTNDYFQISLLSLFSRNGAFDHFPLLATRYEQSSPNVRREIILAARHGQHDWLRELKESVPDMNEWVRSAFLLSARWLPAEERRFFANNVQTKSKMDEILKMWIKQRSVNLAEHLAQD